MLFKRKAAILNEILFPERGVWFLMAQRGEYYESVENVC
jgi:hypothetical protein